MKLMVFLLLSMFTVMLHAFIQHIFGWNNLSSLHIFKEIKPKS